MRILLILTLTLNVLYAGWQYLDPAKTMRVTAPMSEGLQMLELLHEPQLDHDSEAGEVQIIAMDDSNESGVSSVTQMSLEKSSSCYTLGPFKDKNIMQQLRESIGEYVSNIEVRKRQESEKHRYWVYMPPLENRRQAKLMGKKLREKNVNDFYIVLSGEAKNSISLGHFRNPKHANRRMKGVVDQGFKAVTKVIYRDYDIYWLDYKVEVISGEPGFSVDEYLSGGVSQLVRVCDA